MPRGRRGGSTQAVVPDDPRFVEAEKLILEAMIDWGPMTDSDIIYFVKRVYGYARPSTFQLTNSRENLVEFEYLKRVGTQTQLWRLSQDPNLNPAIWGLTDPSRYRVQVPKALT